MVEVPGITRAEAVVASNAGGASMEVFPGISMDPAIRFGKPCLAGTRIDVATILGDLAAGASAEDLEAQYRLSREQITATLRYAAHVAAHLPPAVGSSDENPSR
jgi:uncharacterized protein (DUF433 family)